MKKLLLFFIFAMAAQWCFSQQFVIPIRITDGTNADTLRFGIHPACNDDYNAGYDRYAPPQPPAGAFDCRLRFPPVGASEDFKTDIRSNSPIPKTFYMIYQPASNTGPILLQWDTVFLDSLARDFYLTDNITGTSYFLDMRTTGTLNTTISPFLANGLRITIYPPYTPVQLASFTGTIISANTIRLDWVTISEVNNYGFEVQRRSESQAEFASLPGVFIPGHGTTLERQYYTYTDNTVVRGVWYYRLKQVDLDGTPHYCEPIRVDVLTRVEEKEVAPIEFALRQNYPNPFNPSTEIKFSVEKQARTTLEIFNIVGQKVATLFDDVAEPGQYYRVRFDGASLASGIYLYRLQGGEKSNVKKFVLMK